MKLRTQANASEMTWQGRTQIGGEPGVYDNASYCWPAIELPATLTDNGGGASAGDVTFELTTEGASSFGPPYSGHSITVFALVQIPDRSLLVWQKARIGEDILDKDTSSVTIRVKHGHALRQRSRRGRCQRHARPLRRLYPDRAVVALRHPLCRLRLSDVR